MVAMPTTVTGCRATPYPATPYPANPYPANPYPEPAGWDLARARSRLAVLGYAASQVIMIGLLWLGYGMARHLTDGQTATALANAADLWAFERAVGLPGEDAVQRFVLGHGGLVTFSNWFYVGVHFPLAVLFGVWVFVRHRDAWPKVRNVVVLTTGAALVVHVLYPLAPPRLLGETVPGLSLVDTGAVYGPSPYAKGSGLANQFAAMPSLHVGWALIEAWGVVTIVRTRARWLALAQPVLTFAVVVVTANHYWLDGIVAVVLVFGAVGLVTTWSGLGSPVRSNPEADGTLVGARGKSSSRRGRSRESSGEGGGRWRRSAGSSSNIR